MKPPGDAPAMVTIDAAFFGTAGDAQLLEAFDKIDGQLSSSVGARQMTGLAGITGDPADPSPDAGAVLLIQLDQHAVTRFTDALRAGLAPVGPAQIRHLGGRWPSLRTIRTGQGLNRTLGLYGARRFTPEATRRSAPRPSSSSVSWTATWWAAVLHSRPTQRRQDVRPGRAGPAS